MSKKKITTIPFEETSDQKQKLKGVINKYKDTDGALMPILQEAQEIYSYLPYEVVEIIADELNKSMEEVYGVVSFYSQFRLTPRGKYHISLCLGTVCYVKGSKDIYEEIKNILNIDNGECTKDGKFSLDTTRCIGCCGMAPALMVNDKVYGNVSKKDVKKILEEYK